MVNLVDRWHLSDSPPPGVEPCAHSTAKKSLYPSSTHGVGRRYLVRYTAPDGRQKSESFTKRPKANARVKELTNLLSTNTWTDPSQGKRPFAEIAKDWRESYGYEHRPSTVARVSRAMDRQILPTFGRREIGSITTYNVERWVAQMASTLAPTTVRTVFSYMKAVLSFAEKHGFVSYNAAKAVANLPALDHEETAALSQVQVDALIGAAIPKYRALFVVAAATGLRGGELFGLDVDDVDLNGGVLSVRQQLLSTTGQPYIGKLKTATSKRRVPLAPHAVEALRTHLAAYPPVPHALNDHRERPPVEVKTRLVFTNSEGEPIRRNAWKRMMRTTGKRANEQLAADGGELLPKGTALHDLRHFFASRIIASGASVKTAQLTLGHSSPVTTMSIYAHVLDLDMGAAARSAVLGAFSS